MNTESPTTVLVVHPGKYFSAVRQHPDAIVVADHFSADPDKWEIAEYPSKQLALKAADRIRESWVISQVLAFYSIPGGTARICLCSDGHTRIVVEEAAKTDGVVFLPEPSPVPEDDE